MQGELRRRVTRLWPAFRGRAQGRDLPYRERAAVAAGQVTERDGTEGDAAQPPHAMAERLAVALHLVLAPLGEGQPHEAAVPARADELRRQRRGGAVVEIHASTPPRQITGDDGASHFRLVDALQLVPRMQQAMR